MNARATDRPARTASDWTRKPITLIGWWVIPFVVAIAADHLPFQPRTVVWILALALAWMGTGCLVNAQRCGRLHCYLAGPILLAGAAVAGLLGAGVLSLGAGGLNLMLWTTFGLVVLSLLPELVWGKYPSRAHT